MSDRGLLSCARAAADRTNMCCADATSFNYLMYRILRRGKADIYIRDDSDLIHEIASEVRDIQKLLLDLLLMQDGTPTRLNVQGMRQ